MKFEQPYFLLFLFSIPLLWIFYELYERKRIKESALNYSYVSLIENLKIQPSFWTRMFWPISLTTAGVLLIFSMSRPVITIEKITHSADYIVAIDVSISMAADDVEPSRILIAAKEAARFCSSLPKTSRIGLMTFSRDSSVLVPVTDDHKKFIYAIEKINEDDLKDSTNLGGAIKDSVELLQEGGAVVIVSDGDGSPDQYPIDSAISEASSKDVKIFGIGVGNQSGTLEWQGSEYEIEYSEEQLRNIAESTGGEVWTATKKEDFAEAYKKIRSKTQTVEQKQEEITWVLVVFSFSIVFFSLIIGAKI